MLMNLPFVFIRCLQLLIFVLVGLSSYNAFGLVLLLFCYLDLKPKPNTSVGYCRGFCLCFHHTTPGNRRDIFILSYVVKVSRCSVFRAVNPVNSWLGDRLTLKLSFPWSKMNKDFLNKIQTLQSSLDIYDLRDTLHLEMIVRSCTKNWRGSENALIFSPRGFGPSTSDFRS